MFVRLIGSRESELTGRVIRWDLERMDFSELNVEESIRTMGSVLKGKSIEEELDGGKFL